jgi:hypothetical protein
MNGKRFLAAVFAAIAAVGAAAQVQPKVTANDLKADVSFLASDALEGRGTPSKGLDIAAEYIASEFRRAGLEPAGDDGYFQTADFSSVSRTMDGVELTLEIGGRNIQVDRNSMAIMEPGTVNLDNVPMVVLTDASQDMGDKPVLVNSPRMRSLGNGHSPLVVLMVPPPAGRTRGAPVLQPVPSPYPPVLVVWDAAVSEALTAGATDVKVSAHMPAPATQQPVKLRNVIGVLRGSDPALKDTYVVLSAHYDHLGVRGSGQGDHIFNGANDDASGTSSVIEIAKALASLSQRPRRSIVFLTVFGEELGDLGSRYYCQHPVFPLAKTVANINLEQLGRTDDTEGPRLLQFNLTGFDYTDIAAFLSKAGEKTGIRVVKDEKNSDSFFARSDNASFANAGIPSTTLSVSYIFPDYHRPGDEWPKLDYVNMAKVDGAVALGVYGIADSAEAPQWNKDNPKTARYVEARENKAN